MAGSQNESTFTDKVVKAMSHKNEDHEFITSLFQQHHELYKSPHLRQLYSDSYKKMKHESKAYCSDVAMLKWNKLVPGSPLTQQPNTSTTSMTSMAEYQQLANLQHQA